MKRITAEIITIGDEILYGQILDTNTHWLSIELDKIGVRIVRKTTIDFLNLLWETKCYAILFL